MLEKTVRLSLADSLIHITERSESKIIFDFNRLLLLIKSIQNGDRYPSTTFFIYSELVLAILIENYEQVIYLLNQLCSQRPLLQTQSEFCRILSFSDEVHKPYQKDYLSALNNSSDSNFHIEAPADDLSIQFKKRIESGFRLMEKIMPELADEFKILISDIIMVIGDEKAKNQFDGGSSYFLWGALFLNATSHQNDILMLEVLVHESAHMLLYSCASDEPLVDNHDDDLFPSPLRQDLRPMDGIYHATFVSARMHWAMQKLINSDFLKKEDSKIALRASNENYTNFWAGHKVIKKHGRLTETGSMVMDSALNYMSKQLS